MDRGYSLSNYYMAKIIQTEQAENGNSYRIDFGAGMVLWFDTWEENGEIMGDWNQYIYFLDDADDVKKKAFQEDPANFQTAMDLVSEIN